MEDPVCTASGQTYERKCIAKWLQTKQTDPISNAPLLDKRLVPCYADRTVEGGALGAHRS